MENEEILILNNNRQNLKHLNEEPKDELISNENSTKYNISVQEKLELKRFGHTFTLRAINSINDITNEVLVYFIKEKGWIKLNPTGKIPSQRAAHSSIAKDELILYSFGGAIKNGALADNDIHFLEFSKGLLNTEWGMIKLPKEKNKPPKRYGHAMLYSKPFLIVFGGTSENNHCLNDLWVINIDDFETEEIEWTEVQFNCDKVPSPRTYFSSCICKGGKAKGMILIFGGRGDNKEMLSDLWGLRRHRNGDWEWIQAACKSEYQPTKRFQHSMISFTSKLVILGGRNNSDNLKNAEMPIDVFDFEKMVWSSIYNMNVFRHSSFILERFAFIYGGCQYNSPLEGSDKIMVFDVSYLISQVTLKLKSHILTNYQDVSKTIDKQRVEKSDEEKEEKIIDHKSTTSRSKTEKMINTLCLEPEAKKQPRKSLPIIKIAVNEKRVKNKKKQRKSEMQEIKEEEDFTAPIIMQKADIASVNPDIVNNYILNAFVATASENQINSNSTNPNNMQINNNINLISKSENLGFSASQNSKLTTQSEFQNKIISNNNILINPDNNNSNTNNRNTNTNKNPINTSLNKYNNENSNKNYYSKNTQKNLGNSEKPSQTSSSIKTISLSDSNKFQTIEAQDETEDLYEIFIKSLLRPSEWKTNYLTFLDKNGIPKFRFRREHIIALTKACNEIILTQKMLLRIKTPVKVFGDIHGQYGDLMRFFELWGEPSEAPGTGDINATDYLFLGDYVDRGVNSLETVCLLMALKIKYPEKIHLLRGNHEDRLINSNFGFLEECEFRLADTRDHDELNVFEVINDFFDCLPLAAIIDEEILCIHGGLGGCLTKLAEIEEIKRPLKIVHEANNKTEQIVMDILWSDPTDNDSEYGIQPNIMRDSRNYGNIVKFGPDIVDKFLKANELSMIIRAHECVLDGFERFDGGKLITLFSATDYCKRHKNAGAMLIVNNNFEIIPHLIYPLVESGNRNMLGNSNDIISNCNVNSFAGNFINNNYDNKAGIIVNDKDNNSMNIINSGVNGEVNFNNFSYDNKDALIRNGLIINGTEGIEVHNVSAMNTFGNFERSINKSSNTNNQLYREYGAHIANEHDLLQIDTQNGVKSLLINENLGNVRRHIKWIDEMNNFEKRPPTPLRNRDFIYNNVDELVDYEGDD